MMPKKMRMLVGVVLIVLLFNLPLASALQISNVRAVDVTDTKAVILWETDKAADSFVKYGESKENLRQVGDARLLTAHALPLTGLNQQQEYFYSVESNSQIDDNSGEFYTFTTLEVDTVPPPLEVKFPEIVAGRTLSLNGTSEAGAIITVKINGLVKGSAAAGSEGSFSLTLTLEEVELHTVMVTAADVSGNTISKEGLVKADFKRPVLTLTKLPALITERSIMVNGTISEESSYEIFVNNRSAAKGQGLTIAKTVSLEEGINALRIVAADKAGFETVEEFTVRADLERQFIRAEIENGLQYYENRAESGISGQTKPGSKVFLYVFRPQGREYTPDFSKARAIVTADEKGEFAFKDVNFAQEISDILNAKLENLAPKEVPRELLDITVFSRDSVNQQQQFTYQVYLIAEDALGRTAFQQYTISVNSCSSGDFGFAIESLPEFQRPLRLVPQLLDDGRQEIQAVFSLEYQGPGTPGDPRTGTGYTPGYLPGNFGVGGVGAQYGYSSAQESIDTEQGFRVTSVRLEKACTQSQTRDDQSGLGCRILPNAANVVKNNDGTKYYVTWKL